MKWFQLDADCCEDPKIKHVISRRGNAGFGTLVRIWCFVANHGKKPGYAVDAAGYPLSKQDLVEGSGVSEAEFDDLVLEMCKKRHFKWITTRLGEVLVIPAMSKRSDTYTKRTLRTNFEHSSNNVRLQTNKYKQTNKQAARVRRGSADASQPSPASRNPTKEHKRFPDGARSCPHEPMCPTIRACIEQILADTLAARES